MNYNPMMQRQGYGPNMADAEQFRMQRQFPGMRPGLNAQTGGGLPPMPGGMIPQTGGGLPPQAMPNVQMGGPLPPQVQGNGYGLARMGGMQGSGQFNSRLIGRGLMR